jgi:hypothetical protein
MIGASGVSVGASAIGMVSVWGLVLGVMLAAGIATLAVLAMALVDRVHERYGREQAMLRASDLPRRTPKVPAKTPARTPGTAPAKTPAKKIASRQRPQSYRPASNNGRPAA